MTDFKKDIKEEVEMSATALLVLEQVKKYVDKHNEGYRFIKDLTTKPELNKDISDAQWAVIIDQAWRMAYIKALDDAYLSNEEKMDLNNIRQLENFYQLRSQKRQTVNYALNQRVEKVKKQNVEPPKQISKNSPYYMPSPWDYPTLKMRDDRK